LNRSPLELYSAYLDGRSLGDAEVGELRAWIAADERHAAEFVRFALLHTAITDRLMLGRLIEDLAAHRLDATTQESLAEVIRKIETSSPRVPSFGSTPPQETNGAVGHLWAAAAAALVFVLLGGWALWKSADAPELAVVPELAPNANDADAVDPRPSMPPVVASIGASFDAAWPAAAPHRSGDALLQGGRLSLLGGVVQLNMTGGASVVVEGPSQLELAGPDALRLHVGKASVRINGSDRSFVIDTSTTQVVDLGTEFGVETSAAGDLQVMVFDGAVALAEPTADGVAADRDQIAQQGQRVEAGYQVAADVEGQRSVRSPVEPLTNDRYFVRADEVDVRTRALAGSVHDLKLAVHFARRRIKDLLVFQAFDAPSSGAEFALGIAQSAAIVVPQRGTALGFVDAAGGAAGGIDVQNGPVFTVLDVSAAGPLARAGLLTSSGRVGRNGTDAWLTWRAQRVSPVVQNHNGSAGVSLMFGETSDVHEPMFLGRAAGDREELCMQTAWGHGAPPDAERVTAGVDVKPEIDGVQVFPVDDQPHTWIARIEFRAGADRVSVWIDQSAADVTWAPPQAIMDVADIEFDRIRFAANRGDEIWRFSDFALAMRPQAFEDLSEAVRLQRGL
jgi:hypothetical protein